MVTQVKTAATDGYEALQLGFEEQKEKHLTQPELGHYRADALHSLYDFLGAFVYERVVVRFEFDTDYGIHIVS